MSLMLFSIVTIVYLFFALAIIYFKQKIGSGQTTLLFVAIPIGLSFVIGVAILISVFVSMSP